MDLSIIIPVFNKSGLTRICLSALKRTLPAGVQTEVIVIDNNSTDDTQAVLSEFPWVRTITNARNLGFAAANNQGAAVAAGRLLLLLNNDTEPQPGSIAALVNAANEPGIGVVGARLLFANRTLQHAGVVVAQERFGPYRFIPYHYLWSDPANAPAANYRTDFQIVTGACIMTLRDLYLELGGLDELFWNGYEDVDYCFKVLQHGLRVVYEPAAEIYHYESQSGPMRFSRVAYNSTLLARKWKDFPKIDQIEHYLRAGNIRRRGRFANKFSTFSMLAPKTTVLVHGTADIDVEAFARRLRETRAPFERIVWAVDCTPPSFGSIPVVRAGADACSAARAEMEVRGDRYLAFVESRGELKERWLDRLIEQLEWSTDVVAATWAPELPSGKEVPPLSADARCTLLALRHIPQHETLANFETLDGAVTDLLLRMIPYEYGVRAAAEPVADLPAAARDSAFEERHGATVTEFLRVDPAYVEADLAKLRPRMPADFKASIIMLSWNAPQFTKIALESIREHTKMPHEVIVVDNGSGPETTDWLREQSDVISIFNPTNRGFAAGCNQGIAAATGDYIVLLNNDVVVTDGWLENLVGALQRDRSTGVSAPRSNEIAGHQKLLDLNYQSMEEMQQMAAHRSKDHARAGYFTDRAIGFCLCIDRKVIEQIGGIDERYGTGNFEDDDFCLRVRAAGYRIYICDDVYIHHFGSASFAANSVDYASTMQRNWAIFAGKWGYPAVYPETGYEPQRAIRHGYDRSQHYVPFKIIKGDVPEAPAGANAAPGGATLLLAAIVSDEQDWNVVGSLVRRYLNAFTSNDAVMFAIACTGELVAETVGGRVEKMVAKIGLDPAHSADVLVSDETDLDGWTAAFDAVHRFEVPSAGGAQIRGFEPVEARSPSDLRRLYERLEAAGAPA